MADAAAERLGRRRGGAVWRGIAMPLTLLVLAEIAAIATGLESDSIARPSQILAAGWVALIDGSVLTATVETLLAAAGGLAIGALVGIACGIALGFVTVADRLMFVPIEVLRPIPAVAIIPVAMLVYGFGYRMEMAVVAFATLWPMLILTRAAVHSIDPRLMEVGALLKLSTVQQAVKLILPAIAPRLFVALRLTAGVALVVAVTVEIAANPLGVGYDLMAAQQSLRPDLAFALVLWIGLVGWVVNAGVAWAEGAAQRAMGGGGRR